MTVEVRLRPEAERDLVDAAGWYFIASSAIKL
jgi:plasmid stabilization system protein ParE